MESLKPENLNTLKSEHLREGVNPIMACVGTHEDFKDSLLSGELYKKRSDTDNAHDVDYDGSPVGLNDLGFKNGGYQSYVISKIDSVDKFSRNYYNCTGVVVTGIERGTGNNISFLSHQDPRHFLGDKRDMFCKDLEDQMKDIVARCEEGTVDSVIFGGRYAVVRDFDDFPNVDKEVFMKEYDDSINLLTSEVEKGLGFDPVVVGGPKTSPAGDSVFFDNKKRRLYILREKTRDSHPNPEFSDSFMGSDLDKEKEKWKPGEWSLPI